LRYGFGELIQNFELERVGGAPNGYQLAPLLFFVIWLSLMCNKSADDLQNCNVPVILPTEVQARRQYFGSHAGHYHPLLGINLFNATKRSSIIRLNRIPSNGLHTVFQAINELQHPNLLILLPSKGRHKTCKINAAGLQEACQLCNIQGKLAGTLAQKKATPHLA